MQFELYLTKNEALTRITGSGLCKSGLVIESLPYYAQKVAILKHLSNSSSPI